MSDFLSFLSAVFSHWVALVTGGVITALLAIWERRTGSDVSSKVYWAIIGLFVFLAMFLGWRDQLVAVRSLQNELVEERKKNSPLLAGRIEQIAIGTESDVPEKNTTITIVMSIGNQGAPSIAENWTLLVEMPNRPPIELSLPYVPGGKTLLDDNGKPLARFTAADLIFNKTETVPIPTGSRVRGIAFCSLRGYSRDEFMQADPKLTVRFHDVTGKLWEAVYVPGTGTSTRPGYFPGVEWGINPADSTPKP